MSCWFAMVDAPRDGTVIVGVYPDWSGVCAIRWGVSQAAAEEGWFFADWSDVAADDWAGWIPVPSWREPA